MDSAKLKILLDRYLVEHFPPNQYHVYTGIFLIWSHQKGVKLELVAWELYSRDPARGPEYMEAFNRVERTLFALSAKVPA